MTTVRRAFDPDSAGDSRPLHRIRLGPVHHLPNTFPDRPRPCPYPISDLWRPPGQLGPDDSGQGIKVVRIEVEILQVRTGHIDGRRLKFSYQALDVFVRLDQILLKLKATGEVKIGFQVWVRREGARAVADEFAGMVDCPGEVIPDIPGTGVVEAEVPGEVASTAERLLDS